MDKHDSTAMSTLTTSPNPTIAETLDGEVTICRTCGKRKAELDASGAVKPRTPGDKDVRCACPVIEHRPGRLSTNTQESLRHEVPI